MGETKDETQNFGWNLQEKEVCWEG